VSKVLDDHLQVYLVGATAFSAGGKQQLAWDLQHGLGALFEQVHCPLSLPKTAQFCGSL